VIFKPLIVNDKLSNTAEIAKDGEAAAAVPNWVNAGRDCGRVGVTIGKQA
jgi:hypothetical protein